MKSAQAEMMITVQDQGPRLLPRRSALPQALALPMSPRLVCEQTPGSASCKLLPSVALTPVVPDSSLLTDGEALYLLRAEIIDEPPLPPKDPVAAWFVQRTSPPRYVHKLKLTTEKFDTLEA